jgi:hypothetical protein
LLHIRRAISPSRLCTFISGKRPGDTSSASFSESYRLKHRTTSWSEDAFWITSTSRHDTRTVTPRARPSSIMDHDKAGRRSRMPVPSLHSSVLKWPDLEQVRAAVTEWARALVSTDERVSSIGYAGSYARGDWGVGSDVDLIILVRETEAPFTERARSFDATRLPVPADVLVYTESEWGRMDGENRLGPLVWVATRGAAASP